MPSVYANNKLKQVDNNTWAKLFEIIPKESRVLDVGCSSGNFGAELIKKKGCEVVGLDIDDEDLALARKQLTEVHKKNIEHDEITELGKFDVILMADVIEHLIDPVSALKKLKAQLKSGAVLVFSVPNMANIATRIELLKGRFEYTSYGLLDQTHLHYYDRIQLETVLKNAGFAVGEYNNTIRDIPRDVMAKELNSMGLTVSDKFYELTDHIDSITFQFVGVALAATGEAPHVSVASKTPHDFMSRTIEKQQEDHQKNVKKLQTRLDEKEVETRELYARLDEIYASRSWKLITKAGSVKTKITRPKASTDQK